MDEKQKMLAGEMYNDLHFDLIRKRQQIVLQTNLYNNSFGQEATVRESFLKKILGKIGRNVHFEPNFRCEFGMNISIGDNFYANFDCIMLDANKITIGNNVLFGPRVGLYSANHAIDAEERRQGGCYARPIVIGDNVWIGAGVHIMGGVQIGENSIIGAGSVVTRDVPDNVIAAGVPCRVLRPITEADKTGFDLSVKK
ncbi:MAG: sugar O-acetyltransferase [Bacteroidales bacterium]